MGLFDFFKKKDESMTVAAEPHTLYLPIEGTVITLEEIGDGIFSAGVLGQGCGIKPREETVYAPADGTISQVAETKHAVGITTNDGAEILIHVGMDTVDMNGSGFTVLVETGKKVKCGQPLLKFSISKIEAAGHPTTTAFVVTNSDDFSGVTLLSSGSLNKLTAVMKIQP